MDQGRKAERKSNYDRRLPLGDIGIQQSRALVFDPTALSGASVSTPPSLTHRVIQNIVQLPALDSYTI